MKTKVLFNGLLLSFISFLIVACEADEVEPDTANDKYQEKIPVIDAYYQGDKVWFIHTDVSDEEMATRLTEMVDYPTHYAPYLAEGVDHNKINKIYVFVNGVNREDTEPWGGGPFHYQIDIVHAVPGDTSYTPLKNPHLVSWNEDADSRILKSQEALLEAEKNGALTIQQTDVVVNAPIVRW